MKLAKILRKSTTRFLSIDFSPAFVKIAYIESSGGGFTLLAYDLKKALSAEEERPQVVEFINNFLKANSISEKEVSLTISGPDSILIKQLSLPVVPKEEILQAIKWQLKTEAPFDLENAVFDWQVVREYTDEEGARKSEIMCIFAKLEVINKYLSIISECNLAPLRISSSPFNYANILSRLPDNPPIAAVLDIGYKESTLCIYKNHKLNFIRKLAFSSEKLTQSLVGTLTSDKGDITVTYEKAEEIKKAFGIPQDETVLLRDDIRAIHIISLMRPLLEGLVRELRRSFDYFSSNFKEEEPSLIYMSGGGANLKNLDWYLNKELNIKVSPLPFPDCINVQLIEKGRLNNDQNQIMSALGVALADSADINLLPQEVRTQKIEFVERVSLRVVGITLGAIFLFLLFMVQLQIRDYKKRLKTAQVHLQNLGQLKLLKEKVDLRENLVSKIQKNKVPAEGLLKLISVIVPGNIILDELILDEASHTLSLKGVVSVTGDTAESVLSNFMKEIEASSFFKEANLVASKDTAGVHEFQIQCDLAY
jgi:type IV pilus assembly protein PilM